MLGIARGYGVADLGSSARDELTAQSVAIKKIMKPFSTPVLSKRTYRELKLLKHLRHENVRFDFFRERLRPFELIVQGYFSERHFHFSARRHLLCYRAARYGSPPSADLAAFGETIYSIFLVPNSCMYSRIALVWFSFEMKSI